MRPATSAQPKAAPQEAKAKPKAAPQEEDLFSRQ
jgi:hypothetical protein